MYVIYFLNISLGKWGKIQKIVLLPEVAGVIARETNNNLIHMRLSHERKASFPHNKNFFILHFPREFFIPEFMLGTIFR